MDNAVHGLLRTDAEVMAERSSPETNLSRQLDLLLIQGLDAVSDVTNRAEVFLQDLDRDCGVYAKRLAQAFPIEDGRVSFDRQTNIYLMTEVYQAGGHRALLRQFIAARPNEHHIVVFTGAFENARAFGMQEVVEAGGFPIYPDVSLGLLDRLLWLRNKLAAFSGHRLFTLHHPEDVLAAIALSEIDHSRTYVVHHADTTASVGVDLAAATHLTFRPEQQQRLKALWPDRAVYRFPLTFDPAGLTLRNDSLRAQVVSIGKKTARSVLRRPRAFPREGAFITATCGGEQKFDEDGALGLPHVIVRILRATGGQHVHIGRVSDALKDKIEAALTAAQIPLHNVSLVGEVPSVAQMLDANTVDIFVSSFPIGGGLTIVEAAALGLPIALYAGGEDDASLYLSGATHGPKDALLWKTVEELESAFRDLMGAGGNEPTAYVARSSIPSAGSSRLQKMGQSSQAWFNTKCTPLVFQRRVNAIIALCEGRNRAALGADRAQAIGALVDAEFYKSMYADVVSSGLDPVAHYLQTGEADLRKPNAIFDPHYYLSNLSPRERAGAQAAPLEHYIRRGEAQGYKPHPLFDPVFCRLSLAAVDDKVDPSEELGSRSVLARYLKRDDNVAPHMFFDPRYYIRQLTLPTKDVPLLVHFLNRGIKLGLHPHPLVQPEKLAETASDHLDGLIKFLTREESGKNQAISTELFDPAYFCDDSDLKRYQSAAPNLLWAHLIEGNQIGQNPHILVDVGHVQAQRSKTLASPDVVIKLLATNKLNVDFHPLVQRSYILKQAPYISTLDTNLLSFILNEAADIGFDPHPFFSTQYYQSNYPDVVRAGVNPLVHFLDSGQFEGRIPHRIFDSNAAFKTPSNLNRSHSNLIWFSSKGLARFHPTGGLNAAMSSLSKKTAIGFFKMGANKEAAELLLETIHREETAGHPTLKTEVIPFSVEAQDAVETVEVYPQVTVPLARPSVASPTHIAPINGEYVAPAVTASVYSHATLFPGNDGIRTKTGVWVDHGLFGFNQETMLVKDAGAVAAVDKDKVLLRHFSSEQAFAEGIFACGTYSHNYFHFLVEVLPRVMIAADYAPKSTPILTDAEMPDQHYQALRYFFPERAIHRCARHVSVSVGKLYVGSMANVIHDAFDVKNPQLDATRFHPEIVKRLSEYSLVSEGTKGEDRLLLNRDSPIRSLRNFADIDAALSKRDFRTFECAKLQFSEQLRLFASAGEVVGQSGAHLANILFAPKGTKVFPLFSNTPGTNYYFWSALGEPLGQKIVNIAGWRIKGSNKSGIQDVHENFTVPCALVSPFFPKTDEATWDFFNGHSIGDLLDVVYGASEQALALTGAWGMLAEATPNGFYTKLVFARRHLMLQLSAAPLAEIAAALQHPFFGRYSLNLRSGFVALKEFGEGELSKISEIENYFDTLSKSTETSNTQDADSEFTRMLALAMLLVPAWKLPLVADLSKIPPSTHELYLKWVSTPTFPYLDGEDKTYVKHAASLLEWMSQLLMPDQPTEQRELVAKAAAHLDLGQLLVIDEPVKNVLLARNHLLKHLAVDTGVAGRAQARPMDMSQGRIRVGVLCRTFFQGPDSEAIVAFFKSFDKTKFEVFAYSVNFHDRVVSADDEFDTLFDQVIDHKRTFSSNAHSMREHILEDDLDVFVYANATTFGVREPELALFKRVAPVQMTMNSHVPMAPGFDSFDYFLTGLSDEPTVDISDEDHPETILRVEGPVINYINSLTPKAQKNITRATLGLSEDDVVMISAGSLLKNRRGFLLTMMRALARVPNSKLIIAPYNPGWAGRAQAFAFNLQLAEAAHAVGISLDRVIIMSELSVAEAETVLAMSDIYLSSFPHGGATMTHLSLIYGVPPVVLRRRSARSIDQFLVGSLGFNQLLCNSNDAYIEKIAELAENKTMREKLSADLKAAAKHPVFVASADYSKSMQDAIVKGLQQAAKK